jgi:hypothetical protein
VPRLQFIKGLCYANGFGVSFDPNEACKLIYSAARMGYMPAKFTYRRIHDALFSVADSWDQEDIPVPEISALAMLEVDPNLFHEIDNLYASPSNYMSAAIRLSEQITWLDATLQAAHRLLGSFPDEDTGARNMAILRDQAKISLSEDLLLFDDGNWPRKQVLYIALGILLHEPGSGFLPEILQILPPVNSFDFNLDHTERSITPLMLACRVGNVEVVRLLSQRCKTDVRDASGAIAMHFLFCFPDHTIPEVSSILSRDLDASESYNTTDKINIVEQLCSLEGNPLTFAIRVGNKIAMECLSSVPQFQGCVNERLLISNALHFFHNFISVDYEQREVVYRVLDLLVSLHEADILEVVGFPQDMISILRPIHMSGDEQDIAAIAHLSVILEMVIWRRQMQWIQFGNRYMGKLGDLFAVVIPKLLNPEDATLFLKLLIKGAGSPPTALTMLHSLRSVAGVDRSEIDQLFTVFEVDMCSRNPSPSSLLGTILSSESNPFLALAIAFGNSDIGAFKRILRKAYKHEIHWGLTAAKDALLAVFAAFPEPRIREYLDISNHYIAKSQTATKWKFRPLRWINAKFGYRQYNTTSAVGDAIIHRNDAALQAFLDSGTCQYETFPYHGNVLHLLCTNDSYSKGLQTLMSGLDERRLTGLLLQRTTRGKLTPLEVAYFLGSYRCFRLLLPYYYGDPENGELTGSFMLDPDLDPYFNQVTKLLLGYFGNSRGMVLMGLASSDIPKAVEAMWTVRNAWATYLTTEEGAENDLYANQILI